MLQKADRALRRMRDGWINRTSSSSGHDFVNRALALSGAAARISASEYDRWLSELRADASLARNYETRAKPAMAKLSAHKHNGTWVDRVASMPAMVDLFYMLVRAVRPAYVVETGVAFGTSSALMLAAMKHGGFGDLTSIDIPAYGQMDGMFADGDVGVMVPPEFAGWDLRREDSVYELPRVLEARRPQIFSHDSDHTYFQMSFEYALAFHHLPKGGLLLSDDTNMNAAFGDFSTANRLQVLKHSANTNLGVAASEGQH